MSSDEPEKVIVASSSSGSTAVTVPMSGSLLFDAEAGGAGESRRPSGGRYRRRDVAVRPASGRARRSPS